MIPKVRTVAVSSQAASSNPKQYSVNSTVQFLPNSYLERLRTVGRFGAGRERKIAHHSIVSGFSSLVSRSQFYVYVLCFLYHLFSYIVFYQKAVCKKIVPFHYWAHIFPTQYPSMERRRQQTPVDHHPVVICKQTSTAAFVSSPFRMD